MNKICTICNEEKYIDLFSNDKHKKDGKRPECKSCKAIRDNKYKSIWCTKLEKKFSNGLE